MKLCVVLLLLLCAIFPLFAQTPDETPNVPIYIPPITGTGSTPEDNDIFAQILAIELTAWNFTIVTEPHEAEYSLIGTLSDSVQYTDGEEIEGKWFFLLSLNKDGLTLYEQGALYATAEDANTYIPTLLRNILSNVFVLPEPVEEVEPIDDTWRNKRWYVGATLFWNPRIYHGDRTGGNISGLALSLWAEYHLPFWRYAALGTGLEFASDWFAATPRVGDDYRNTLLQIPFVFKYVWRHKDIFMHEPYAGILLNLPLFPETTPALLSWQAGFQFGMNIGPGVAYADARYAMDIGKSGLHRNRATDTRQYDRYMLYLGIGYKYDFVEVIVNKIRAWSRKRNAIIPEEVVEIEEELIEEGEEESIEIEEEPIEEDEEESIEIEEEPIEEGEEESIEIEEEPIEEGEEESIEIEEEPIEEDEEESIEIEEEPIEEDEEESIEIEEEPIEEDEEESIEIEEE